MNKLVRELFCAIGIWKARKYDCGPYTVKFFLPDRNIECATATKRTDGAESNASHKIVIGDCVNETGKNAQISIDKNATKDFSGLNVKDRVKSVLLMAPYKKFGAEVKVFSEMLFTEFCRIGAYRGFSGTIGYYDYESAQMKSGCFALFVIDKNTIVQIGSNDFRMFNAILDTITIENKT